MLHGAVLHAALQGMCIGLVPGVLRRFSVRCRKGPPSGDTCRDTGPVTQVVTQIYARSGPPHSGRFLIVFRSDRCPLIAPCPLTYPPICPLINTPRCSRDAQLPLIVFRSDRCPLIAPCPLTYPPICPLINTPRCSRDAQLPIIVFRSDRCPLITPCPLTTPPVC